MVATFVFRPRTFAVGVVRLRRERRPHRSWYYPCLSRHVPETPMRLVYDEPTVMWRMRRAGRSTHAVIGPRPDGAVVVWFINGRPLGFRDFGDWTSALRWSDQMQAQNWAVGWRLEPE